MIYHPWYRNPEGTQKEDDSSKILFLSVFGGGYNALIGGLYEKQSLE